MGHKINPEIFRLGTSIDWKYQLRDPLLSNITIYKTIKKMFMEYSAPYISANIRRQTNPRAILKKEVKKNTRIESPFLKNSFFFSHLNISYIKNLQLYIFLFDENFEKKRVKKGIFEKPQYYLSEKFFSRDSKHDLYFKKEIYLSFKNSKKFIFKNKKWKTYIVLYKNKKFKRWKKLLLKNPRYVCIKANPKKILIIKKFKRGIFKENNKKKQFNFPLTGLWILNTISENLKYNSLICEFRGDIKKLKILLRLLPLYINRNRNQKFFFFVLFLQFIFKLIFLIEKPYLKKKLLLFSLLMNLSIVTMQYKYFKNKMHIKLKKSRFFTFNLYSKLITYTLQKTCFIEGKKNVSITYLGLANKNVSASLLLNMLIIQLGDYINFKHILRNMTKRLNNLVHIQGFRIILSGRLTRKERAAYIVKNYKSIPLSTYSTLIDYASGFKIMKFGCVGIKIYLRIDNITTPPYWYSFRFENHLKYEKNS